MKALFVIVACGTLLGVVVFVRAWLREDDARVERWASRYYGAYPRLYGPDDPSRLDRLRKIAAAQHSQDQ